MSSESLAGFRFAAGFVSARDGVWAGMTLLLAEGATGAAGATSGGAAAEELAFGCSAMLVSVDPFAGELLAVTGDEGLGPF